MNEPIALTGIVLEVPRDPYGFSRMDTGLYIPGSRNPKEIITGVDGDVLFITNQRIHSYERTSLWQDAPASVNRIVDICELGQLKKSFGDLHRYRYDFNAVIQLLNSSESINTYTALVKEFYSLINEIDERAPSDSLEYRGLWDVLSLMADHILIQSNMNDLPMLDSLLQLAVRALNTNNPPESLLDFISHFDIPKELASALIDIIDQHPNHPLYWWVASRCPEHPEVIRQQHIVRDIMENPQAIIRYDDIALLMPLGLLIDEPHATFSKTGIELESNVFIDAVLVPQKTMMGVDVAKKGGIFELRLNHLQYPDVLLYGPVWLRRYFEIWRWEKTARCLSSSVHFHSEGYDSNKVKAARRTFGTEYDDCRINDLGTIEVRTALSGYKDSEHVLGFPYLPHPSFIELLHACNDSEGSLYALSRARVDTTVFSARMSDPQSPTEDEINSVIDSNDFIDFEYLIQRVSILQPYAQETVIQTFLNSKDSNALKMLAIIIEFLNCNDTYLTKVVVACIERRDKDALITISDNIDLFPQGLQDIIVRAVVNNANDYNLALKELTYKIGNLNVDLQRLILYAVIEMSSGNMLSILTRHITEINVSLHAMIVHAVIDSNNLESIMSLSRNVGKLDINVQETVVRAVINSNNFDVLSTIFESFDTLRVNYKRMVIQKASEYDGFYDSWAITDNIGKLDLELQRKVVKAVIDSANNDTLELLARNIEGLALELRGRVVKAVIDSQSSNIIVALSMNIGVLNLKLQKKVVTAIIEREHIFEITVLSDNIEYLNTEQQKRVVEVIVSGQYTAALDKLAKKIITLHEDLHSDIINAVITNGGVYAVTDIIYRLRSLGHNMTSEKIESILKRFTTVPPGTSYNLGRTLLPS